MPGRERQILEQARAILSDPGKREYYDARLNNPHAPAWTPRELHELALAPSSQPPAPGGLAASFAAIPRRILALIAGGLGLILVGAIVLASCTGGGGSDVATSGNDNTGSSDDSGSASCAQQLAAGVKRAGWAKGSIAPLYTIVLTGQHQTSAKVAALLPTSQLSPYYAANYSASGIRLVQYQDKNVGLTLDVRTDENSRAVETNYLDVFSPDGKLVSSATYAKKAEMPATFDLQESLTSGYHHIVAGQGVTIPPTAVGAEAAQTYATVILPDAFDKTALWVLLRGGDQLYKGTLIRQADAGSAAEVTDPSACSPVN